MSYVEHCDKHGQYHADYICGDCHEALREAIRGLLLTSRERADDHIFGDTGYRYWEEKAWEAVGGRCP